MRVMQKESGCNPIAENKKDYHSSAQCWGSYGLMQVGCLHAPYPLYDPTENIAKAYELYKKEKWKPWGVCNFEATCSVLK